MAADTEEDEAYAKLRRRTEDIADIGRLQTQEGPLEAVWTGLSTDDTGIVVHLTDPAPYVEALLAILDHPERVCFQQSALTHLDLEKIRREVVSLVDDRSWRSHGTSLDHVDVTLRSNRTALAEQLHQQFGDVLQITLGRHRFPLNPSEVLDPPPMPVSTVELPDLACTVDPDQYLWAPGEDIHGQVHLRNDGHEPVVVSGHSVGVLLDSVGRLVGEFSGMMLLGEQLKTIPPGTQDTIRFTAGSDTSDPALGAALPPGTYSLLIPLHVYDVFDITPTRTRVQGDARTLVTQAVPIQLAP